MNRICEVFFQYREKPWVQVQFGDLKRGNIFRMYEPVTKYPVKDNEGNHQFIMQAWSHTLEGDRCVEVAPLTHIKEIE